MKRFLLLLLFVTNLGIAQNTGITYQAVIYNPAGEELPGVNNPYAPLINQNICLQFGVINADGIIEYQEQAQTTTDAFGMVNLLIGTHPQSGGYATDFSEVQWTSDPKFLIVDLDVRGNCSNFMEISNQPLSYVPFAHFAENSSADDTVDALSLVVDQNQADSDAADATLQAAIDANAAADAEESAAGNAADAALQLELDSSQSGAGLQDNGSYVTNTSMNYINASTSIVDATEDLDSAIATLQELVNTLTERVETLELLHVPVITLIGEAQLTIDLGSEYTDGGATAEDLDDGDLTESITVVNGVDSSTPGTYSVIYNVTDSDGNEAEEVVRTVIVPAPVAESYSVNSMDPAVFSDPGFLFMIGPGCDPEEFFYCDGGGNVEITIPNDAYSATPESIEVKLTFTWLDEPYNGENGIYLSLNNDEEHLVYNESYFCYDDYNPEAGPGNWLTVTYEIPVVSWNGDGNNYLFIDSPCFVLAPNANGNYMELTFNY